LLGAGYVRSHTHHRERPPPAAPWRDEDADFLLDLEIGWHLHPDAWGHGYATEAAAAVLDDAFSRGLARVIAVTDPDNRASQAVCRRLGMRHFGRTTRYYDTPNEHFRSIRTRNDTHRRLPTAIPYRRAHELFRWVRYQSLA